MFYEKRYIVYFTLVVLVICNINGNKIDSEKENEPKNVSSYAGEYFPDEYLEEDITTITVDDLNDYINGLSKVISKFASLNLNKTADINKMIGVYFMTGILKRTIMDYWTVLDKYQYETLLDILKKGDTIASFYMAGFEHDFNNDDYRASLAFTGSLTLAYSLGDFKRNRMRKWIKTNSSVNNLLEQMDKRQLCKKEYARLMSLFVGEYYIQITDSDYCLDKVAYNPVPINITEMRPCKPDPYCYKAISSTPSIAYTLSHRIVNLLIYRFNRRCYFDANDKDEDHIESLCAQMYRESVYIARRGFFSRDMFMEHVGLCGMMGYEEFFRWKWFHKMNSWIDREGCITENTNFYANRTALLKNVLAKFDFNADKQLAQELRNSCISHVMSVYLMTMSNAIRHAAHQIASSRLSQQQGVDPHWVPPLEKIKHI